MEIVDLIKEEQPEDFQPAYPVQNIISPAFPESFSAVGPVRSGQNIIRSLAQSDKSKYDHFGILKKLFPEQSDNVRDLVINAVIIFDLRF